MSKDYLLLYFILILKTKNECKTAKKNIENFINTKLHLQLNEKSRVYPYKMGVNFCGYRIFTTHRLLRTNSKKKIKNNVKKWNKKYVKGTLDITYAMQSLNSWIGHSSHCNSYKLKQKILNKCDFLYSDSSYLNSIYEQRLIDLIENQSKTDIS